MFYFIDVSHKFYIRRASACRGWLMSSGLIQIQSESAPLCNSGRWTCLLLQACCIGVAVTSQIWVLLSIVLWRQVRQVQFPTEEMETDGKCILFTREKGLYLSFSFKYQAYQKLIWKRCFWWWHSYCNNKENPVLESEFCLPIRHNIYWYTVLEIFYKSYYQPSVPRPWIPYFNSSIYFFFSAYEEIVDVFFSIVSPKSRLKM